MPHKMKRYISIIILMGLLLASCGQRPVSGYIVGKKHELKHSETHYDVVLKMPITRSIPEKWVVYVADSCGVTPCNVTPETYERLEKGQFVTAKGFE